MTSRGFQTRDERLLLDLPEAQPIIARIAANVDPTFPRRRAHIESVATVVIRAKKRPNNAYARPTL